MSSRIITALAVLLGAGAIVLIVLGLRLQNESGLEVVEREPEPAEELVEADEPEEPELVEEPVEPERVATQVVVVARDLQAGDLVTTELLRAPDALADRLRPGQRAFAVPVDELAAVGGLLKPGDYVDVLAHLEDENEDASRVLVEYAAVLSFGPSLERNNDGEREQDTGSRTAVLALEREAVPVLLMAQQHGRLSLALTSEPEDDVVIGGLTEEAMFARPSEYSRPGGEPSPAARNQAPNRAPVSIHRGTSRQEVER